MFKPLTSSELLAKVENEPETIKSRKIAARQIAAIGSYDAELELRLQTRAYHRLSGNARTNELGHAGDGMPYSSPKHRKATTKQRKRIDYATVCFTYTLRHPDLYFYAHDVSYYLNAHGRGYITTGELRTILQTIKKMA